MSWLHPWADRMHVLSREYKQKASEMEVMLIALRLAKGNPSSLILCYCLLLLLVMAHILTQGEHTRLANTDDVLVQFTYCTLLTDTYPSVSACTTTVAKTS